MYGCLACSTSSPPMIKFLPRKVLACDKARAWKSANAMFELRKPIISFNFVTMFSPCVYERKNDHLIQGNNEQERFELNRKKNPNKTKRLKKEVFTRLSILAISYPSSSLLCCRTTCSDARAHRLVTCNLHVTWETCCNL